MIAPKEKIVTPAGIINVGSSIDKVDSWKNEAKLSGRISGDILHPISAVVRRCIEDFDMKNPYFQKKECIFYVKTNT